MKSLISLVTLILVLDTFPTLAFPTSLHAKAEQNAAMKLYRRNGARGASNAQLRAIIESLQAQMQAQAEACAVQGGGQAAEGGEGGQAAEGGEAAGGEEGENKESKITKEYD